MSADTFIIIICAIITVGGYIYLKVTNTLWYGINWGYIFRSIRKWWHNHK